jgi:hypothetical protein
MSVAEGRTDGGRTEGRRSGLRGVIWSLVVGVGSTMAERNQILPEFIEGGDPTVCSTCSISWTFFFPLGPPQSERYCHRLPEWLTNGSHGSHGQLQSQRSLAEVSTKTNTNTNSTE